MPVNATSRGMQLMYSYGYNFGKSQKGGCMMPKTKRGGRRKRRSIF